MCIYFLSSIASKKLFSNGHFSHHLSLNKKAWSITSFRYNFQQINGEGHRRPPGVSRKEISKISERRKFREGFNQAVEPKISANREGAHLPEMAAIKSAPALKLTM
jgi:hypothetical protein